MGHTDKEVLCNNVLSLRPAIIEPNRGSGCVFWVVCTVVFSNEKKCYRSKQLAIVKGNEIWVVITCTVVGKEEGRKRKTKLQPSQQPQHCSVSTFRPPSLRPAQLWHHIVATVYHELDLDLTNHTFFESLSFCQRMMFIWSSVHMYDDHHMTIIKA